MGKISRSFVAVFGALFVAGCSVFGDSGVEIAPYEVLISDDVAEVRYYEAMILVSAPIDVIEDSEDSAFRKLFRYISGNNEASEEIAMTAPVFMDRSSENKRMSFVLPASFSIEDVPVPADPSVEVSKLSDVTYAVITFNGRLQRDNIEAHREELSAWLAARPDIEIAGPAITAGYNPPWTIPMMRRNEVLIPVKTPTQ